MASEKNSLIEYPKRLDYSFDYKGYPTERKLSPEFNKKLEKTKRR